MNIKDIPKKYIILSVIGLFLILIIFSAMFVFIVNESTKYALNQCIENNENIYNECINFVEGNCKYTELTDQHINFKYTLNENWIQK